MKGSDCTGPHPREGSRTSRWPAAWVFLPKAASGSAANLSISIWMAQSTWWLQTVTSMTLFALFQAVWVMHSHRTFSSTKVMALLPTWRPPWDQTLAVLKWAEGLLAAILTAMATLIF